MRIALGQAKATVGDFDGNVAKGRALAQRAREGGARWLLLPELFICGAPPLGFALDRDFLEANGSALEELAAETREGGFSILVGAAGEEPDGTDRKSVV